MRKLDVPKSGWIRSVRVDFMREGLLRGSLGVEIEMSGDASRGSFEDVAAVVESLLGLELPKRRLIRFVGTLTDHDPNFMLLVKSLYDYGFELQCVIGDAVIYSWLQWISWVIVRTKNHVLMTACDELWFVPDELPEDVTLPLRSNRPTFCFVSGKLQLDDVDKFMCRSRHQWGLL